jgi:LPS export ABC transporter protein LptC
MKGHVWIFTGCFILLAALCLWLLLLKPENGISPLHKPSLRESPQARLLDVHLVEMEDNQRMWEADADQIEVFEEKNRTRILKLQKQIKMVLYMDKDVLTCYADEAQISDQAKRVDLLGNLMAESQQGIVVRTDSVQWFPQEKKLRTDKPVTVVRQGLTVQGLGMEADLALEEVRILSNISSSFQTSDQQLTPKGLRKDH